jgi:hypothetical protein
MQKKIIHFVWAGQRTNKAGHHVDAATITKPKEDGRLGLLSIPIQTCALVGRFSTWILMEEEKPNQLCELLRYYIKKMSFIKWGVSDYT